jgi:ectoine hydroxylase-related dioxygenase (phytanoyl-CoA dioxygenase family)
MLDASQIEQYHRDGYIAIPKVLSDEQLAQARRVMDEFVERARSLDRDEGAIILEPTHTPQSPRIQRIDYPVKAHPVFDEIMRSHEVLDIVAALIGPNIRYHSSKVNMKAPSGGSAVEWHQDIAFFPHTNDDLLTVGIPLDDSTEENGCLLVAPGSHRAPMFDHHQNDAFVGAVSPEAIDKSKVVPVTMPAGGMSVHHARTLHGSAPNRSSRSRRLFLITYTAADAWPIGVQVVMDEFHARVVRGEPTRKARMMDLVFDMRQPGAARSLYELQANVKQSAFRKAA